jgi:streptomycin 6-kinase
LAALPALVGDLERSWAITIGATMPNATEAYVAGATLATGEPAVLKLTIPGVEKIGREFAVLQAAQGHGYARLLQHDPASGAMLLERLGPQLFQLGYPIERRVEIICTTLREAWETPPPDVPLMTGARKAEAMAATVRAVTARFPDACSARAIRSALDFAAERGAAFDPATSVLGHGDAHYWNTLADPDTGGYKFVDPEGLLIEPAHDLSISLREGSRRDDFLGGDPLPLGRARCELLARLAGVDPAAIWQWGLLENLVNGLLYIDVGSPENGAAFIEVAEAWASAEAS